MHSKAVVTKPQNVFVLRDIMMNGYIGGCGTKFFPSQSGHAFMHALNQRLGLDEAYMADTQGIHSMIALPCSFSTPMHEVVGLSDRILPWTVAQNAEKQYSHFPGGKIAWMIFYNLGFDFSTCCSLELSALGTLSCLRCNYKSNPLPVVCSFYPLRRGSAR